MLNNDLAITELRRVIAIKRIQSRELMTVGGDDAVQKTNNFVRVNVLNDHIAALEKTIEILEKK